MLTGARRESVVADCQLPNKRREARVIWEHGESQPEDEGGNGGQLWSISKGEGQAELSAAMQLVQPGVAGRNIRNIRELKLNSVSAACVGCVVCM